MAKLLSENIKDDIFDLFDSTKDQINIISPFIGMQSVKELLRIKNEKNININLITRFKRQDFFSNASNLDALKLLIENNIPVYAVKNLHTKLYLVDESSMILGSSNFTNGGFITNIELNVLFEKEDGDSDEIIEAGNNYFSDLLNKVMNYKITLDRIQREKDEIEPHKKQAGWSYDPKVDYGYEAEKEKNPKTDILTKYLTDTEENSDSIETTAWIKFEGFSDERRMPGDEIQYKKLVNGTYKTYFPKRPRGFKNGDLVFIGVQSYDLKNNKTVMIYGYGIARKWDKSMEATIEEKRNDSRRVRWPFFAYIDNFKYINKEIKYSLPITDLLTEIGNNTYPSTVGTKKNVFITHCQKDKLKITDAAKEYLLSELNKRDCK